MLARVDELLILIVKTLEAMAPDTTTLAIELLSVVEDRRVLGDHVSGMALLASRLIIFRVIQRPEPMRVAAVSALDGIDRAAVSAVARRTTELLQRMPLN